MSVLKSTKDVIRFVVSITEKFKNGRKVLYVDLNVREKKRFICRFEFCYEKFYM